MDLVAARAAALAFYSPYHCLRHLSPGKQQELFGAGVAARWGQRPGEEMYAPPTNGTPVHWLWQQLPWDSAYFGTSMVRLFTGLFGDDASAAALIQAAAELREHLAGHLNDFYAFSIVPAEDVRLFQALTAAGWRLVETRLTYYRNDLANFQFPKQPVRAARLDEAAHIGRVSAAARNPYDRFHADAWFGQERADAYLSRYAENTVSAGLATTVLVPDEPGLPLDSFLAISDLTNDGAALGAQLSRVLLTAVGPANRGWHLKLTAETLRRAQAQGHDAVLMTTQVTNHAVFRSAEKLGFRLGGTSYVLACNSH